MQESVYYLWLPSLDYSEQWTFISIQHLYGDLIYSPFIFCIFKVTVFLGQSILTYSEKIYKNVQNHFPDDQ